MFESKNARSSLRMGMFRPRVRWWEGKVPLIRDAIAETIEAVIELIIIIIQKRS